MGTTLRLITEDDLRIIMDWRMSETVTRYMDTNPKLTLEGQKKWLDSLRQNDRTRYWLIEVDKVPAGIINLADIDWENGNASWGYYIGEERLRSLRLAISLEMGLYDYCFDVLGFQEVHNEAFKLNEGVWKLHVACGCRIVREAQGEVEKEGVRYDIVHLSIGRNEWLEMRETRKYEKINFDLFQDRIGGIAAHHLGVAVADLEASVRGYMELGWIWDGAAVADKDRKVELAFLKHAKTGEMLELVCPAGAESPVSSMLTEMKNIAVPYHICYEVDDIEKTVQILRGRNYILTAAPKPAAAFGNRRVAFLLRRDTGLVELLEKRQTEDNKAFPLSGDRTKRNKPEIKL